MKSTHVTIVLLILILICSVFFTYLITHPGETIENSDAARTLVGDETTPTMYTDLTGSTVNLGDFAGQVRVVNSWATWSPFSANELTDLETLAAQFNQGEGVVIAINRGEPAAKVKAFLDRVGSFEHIHFVLDEADHYYTSVAGFAMPETIFYDASGKIITHKRGVLKLEEMQTLLNEAMDAQN